MSREPPFAMTGIESDDATFLINAACASETGSRGPSFIESSERRTSAWFHEVESDLERTLMGCSVPRHVRDES